MTTTTQTQTPTRTVEDMPRNSKRWTIAAGVAVGLLGLGAGIGIGMHSNAAPAPMKPVASVAPANNVDADVNYIDTLESIMPTEDVPSIRDSAIGMAHALCTNLSSGGNYAGLSAILNEDMTMLTPQQNDQVLMAAVQNYCPQYVNDVAGRGGRSQ